MAEPWELDCHHEKLKSVGVDCDPLILKRYSLLRLFRYTHISKKYRNIFHFKLYILQFLNSQVKERVSVVYVGDKLERLYMTWSRQAQTYAIINLKIHTSLTYKQKTQYGEHCFSSSIFEKEKKKNKHLKLKYSASGPKKKKRAS